MTTRLLGSSMLGDTQEAFEFISSILEASTEYSIIGKDLDGNILLWNEGARRLYGYEPDEVIGKANSRILHTPEDVQSGRPRQIMEAALRDGKWQGTVTRQRKNGERFPARVAITSRHDSSGRPVGFVLTSRDISDESHLTEQLQATQFYTRSLIESSLDPLVTISLDGTITDVNDASDQGIGIPAARIDRLFCPFTQVDNSTTRNYGGTGLGLAICKQLVELMGGQIGLESQVGTGSTFWFELPLQVTCETNELPTAAEENVMTGARVLVVANEISAPSQIVEHLQAWGCHMELVTTDQDALASVARAKSADQFWDVALVELPADASSRRELIEMLSRTYGLPVIGFGGTASDDELELLRDLGLRQLLRDPLRPSSLHDALSSTLSAASMSPKQPAPTLEPRQQLLLQGHVLVAEDNRINQMFVTELLMHCGCTCDVASNGDEALAALQCHGYDLVLMDCQMPEMDGFTAAEEIRRREANGQLSSHHPIIALTANALNGDRERCLAAGMDDYLSKPIAVIQLQAMLAKYLRLPIVTTGNACYQTKRPGKTFR